VSRHLHRVALRFSRNSDEAFRTPRYASAVEYYVSNRLRDRFWRFALRILRPVWAAIVRWL
jgi:hypothetical protein